MTHILSVDVGQSGFRVGYDGSLIEEGKAGVVALTSPDRVSSLVDLIASIAPPLPTGTSVGVGLSGFVEGSDAPARIAGLLQDRLDARHVIVAADAVTAYLGTVGTVPGTATICGTGVASLGADGNGALRRVDARGYLLGDLGGGFWIGQRGLHAALDAVQGRGDPTSLAEELPALGGPEAIYHDAMSSVPAPKYVAAFARTVIAAAETADRVALRIIEDAAKEIARTTAAARIGSGPIGLTGGLLQSPLYTTAVERAFEAVGIDTHGVIVRPDASLHGAWILAAHPEFSRLAFRELIAEKEAS
ncbi:BadF/BadG/BcrA/BcrD ATPase family protein [Microbacterium sp.]|uniref:BadF/BadG/BcrA/BcrD ATPase family protein n=1 Tax=Microbacterium sp. TaxID=51671 RepID=UPI003F9E9A2F